MPDPAISVIALRLDSIQVGSARPFPVASDGSSGIHKEPVPSAHVERLGLVSDTVVDQKHHGGPDQAVYLYMQDDYDWWEGELGRDLPGGTFGENLTISGIGSADTRVGDVFDFGDVRLAATAARIPCGVFHARMGIPNWVERFRDARRPGVYCRVISEGELESGAEATLIAGPADNITILETQDLFYDRDPAPERVAAALASPICERSRARLEKLAS